MKIKESQMTDIEKEIIKYINEYKKEEYSEIIEKDNRLEVILALSDLRRNIISWYPFKENGSILEIGADLGQITEILCKNANKVVALEVSEEKRKAIAKRHQDIKNLTVVEKIEDIDEKFDYITIIGIERLTDSPKEMLVELKKYLKVNGKILMVTDNRLGMKYFSTLDNKGEKITNIADKKLYILDELIKQVEDAGFKNKKIYYPMTDYRLTNVIYTDKKPLSKNNLSRNIVYNKEDTIKFYEQNNVYRELLKEDESNINAFINSFFIEIFNEEYEENEIKLVSFSNMRKKEYRIKTVIGKEYVYKYSENHDSNKHIDQIKENIDILKHSNLKTVDDYDDEKIISKYTDSKTLDKVIIELIKEDKYKAIELIKKFKQELMQKLEEGNTENNVFKRYGIEYSKEVFRNVKFVKHGLWDLIFQNCFYINEEFYFYDQEWSEDNVPIDFILYRAIKYFNRIKKYISEDELYMILEINEEMLKIFEKLDNKIQEKIRDNTIWKIHNQGITIEDLKIQKLTDNHTINLLRTELGDKNREINELKEELAGIYQSKSWRIMEQLGIIKRKK